MNDFVVKPCGSGLDLDWQSPPQESLFQELRLRLALEREALASLGLSRVGISWGNYLGQLDRPGLRRALQQEIEESLQECPEVELVRDVQVSPQGELWRVRVTIDTIHGQTLRLEVTQ